MNGPLYHSMLDMVMRAAVDLFSLPGWLFQLGSLALGKERKSSGRSLAITASRPPSVAM